MCHQRSTRRPHLRLVRTDQDRLFRPPREQLIAMQLSNRKDLTMWSGLCCSCRRYQAGGFFIHKIYRYDP